MKNYEVFSYTGYSFEEMVGEPDEISSAIGHLVFQFSELEDALFRSIAKISNSDSDVMEMICVELSFRQKVHCFSSIMKHMCKKEKIKFEFDGYESAFDEIVKMCFKCEEMRNQILHSNWVHDHLSRGGITRQKVTAKSSKGFHKTEERLDAGKIQDIADYFCYTSHSIEEFVMNGNMTS